MIAFYVLLKADCRHPLPTDYKQTLRRLDVDLREFLVKDRRNRNHTEIILASSPFVRTTVDLSRRVKCEPNAESGLTGLSENLIGAPIELTCNGYYQQHMPTPYEYIAHFHGQQEAMVLAQSNQYMSFNNGNIMEVHTGRITEGKCKGDDLYVQTVYTNDNPLACIDGLVINQIANGANLDKRGIMDIGKSWWDTWCNFDKPAPVQIPTQNEPKMVLIGVTPFVNTTVAESRMAECGQMGDSRDTIYIGEELTDIPLALTCNGYFHQRIPYNYTLYVKSDHGDTTEVLGMADSQQTMIIVNGRCKGDFLYVHTVYANLDPKACVETPIRSQRITQMDVKIFGNKCGTTCSLLPHERFNSFVTYNPGYSNSGRE
ncbi:unnamed protein product [Medioppia subpectinata]|uniref:Uncharacterized protein n=1 Tax=Medioppia subpectinata TaxID=1979941 RepID=A0A7R9PWG0_9ACAR|nr:unnamed protein product [Medioppia subpectinata]CAG2102863.1 unnamed protein product [Medioppia subpectinata]